MVLRRYSTTWLVLCLLPYLCFALIGELPHQHGHGAASACRRTLTATTPGMTLTAADNDCDHCPLCEAQAAFGACAALPIVHLVVPVTCTPRIIVHRALAQRHLAPLTASRAPPASLS